MRAEEKKTEPRWNVDDRVMDRLRPFGFADKFDVSDFIDETGLGDNIIAKVLETAANKCYVVPRGMEYRNTEMFIRTQLPDTVLEVLHWLDKMRKR